MQDFTIDCSLFLRLTDQALGEFGQYRITAAGIQARITEQKIQDDALLNTEESVALLEHVRDACLPFPTTAVQLLEWLNKNEGSGFEAPDWFKSVVTSCNANEANVELDKAALALNAKMKKVERKVSTLPNKPVIAKYVANQDLSKIRSELEAVQTIRRSVRANGDASITLRNARNDPLRVELREVFDNNPDFTPSQVMDALKKRAGQPTSCITEALLDGVMWRRNCRQPEKLTLPALRSRISRLKQRPE